MDLELVVWTGCSEWARATAVRAELSRDETIALPPLRHFSAAGSAVGQQDALGRGPEVLGGQEVGVCGQVGHSAFTCLLRKASAGKQAWCSGTAVVTTDTEQEPSGRCCSAKEAETPGAKPWRLGGNQDVFHKTMTGRLNGFFCLLIHSTQMSESQSVVCPTPFQGIAVARKKSGPHLEGPLQPPAGLQVPESGWLLEGWLGPSSHHCFSEELHPTFLLPSRDHFL